MTRGGKRKGAGRPKGTDKRKVSFWLPNTIADWLRDEAKRTRKSQAEIITTLIVKTTNDKQVANK